MEYDLEHGDYIVVHVYMVGCQNFTFLGTLNILNILGRTTTRDPEMDSTIDNQPFIWVLGLGLFRTV